jgi:uncharacterized protein with GYD domain
MPGYIQLIKVTQQGAVGWKRAPADMEGGRAAAEKMGIRNIGFWVTMGEYDVIAIWDAPDDQTMANLALIQGMRGDVTTQTMRAFSEEEFATIVSRLPQ